MRPEVNATRGRRQGRGATTVVCLLVFLLLLPLTPAIGAPTDTVVRVICLDDEGNPQSQGMGVVLRKEGRILTSAALLAPYRGAIIMISDGTKYPIRQVSQWNFFQDLVLAQVEAEALSPAPLGAKHVSPGEIVWVAVRKNPPALKEGRVTKVLPFSPRLIILKLDPTDLETDPGAPGFNGRGELVGMRHAFAQKQEKPFQFFLARNRSHLPAEKPTQEGEKSGFTGELVDEQLINAYQKTSGAFWEGVAASLRQDWPGARENFSTALRLSESLPEAYFGRGVARYHLGEYEEAARDLERATQGLSNYALSFLWLGKVWERQNRGEAAFASHQKAVAADPRLREAR